jgi:type IV pilus assembly protein PilV
MNTVSRTHSQRGFTLIEVMVSVLVVSVSVLGTAGLQISAKRAGHEAAQRTSGASLAQDMLERMRANPQALSGYVTTGIGGGTITSEPSPGCTNNTTDICTPAQLAAHDMWDWEQALDGAAETRVVGGSTVTVGGLLNPTGCVSLSSGEVTITIAWEGYQSLSNTGTDSCGSGLGKYGTDDAKRQVLTLSTFVTSE